MGRWTAIGVGVTVWATLAWAAPPDAAACASEPLSDFELATRADTVFVGRLVASKAKTATFTVTRSLRGIHAPKRKRVTVQHCGRRPNRHTRDHLVFVDGQRRAINGIHGIQALRPGRADALAAWLGATDDPARIATLLERYQRHRDREALAALLDRPRLLALLDGPARDALVRHIGSVPMAKVEVAALARLRRRGGTALLALAVARCDPNDFSNTPCLHDIPHALAYLRRPEPPADRPGLARQIQGAAEALDRHVALDRCAERKRQAYVASDDAPRFTRRFGPGEVAGLQTKADWKRASAWCAAGPAP